MVNLRENFNRQSSYAQAKRLRVTCVVLLLWVGVVPVAQAYLDPGTFSFVIQTLVAALVGALFVIKSYWISIKSWFSGKSADSEAHVDDVESSVEQSGSKVPTDKDEDSQ